MTFIELRTAMLAATLICTLTLAAAQSQRCVTVEVQNVRPQQGQLMLAAYGDAESFGKKALLTLKVPAGDATTRFELCGVSGSALAITMYQDLDGDGTMARNLLGMPTEPWGSSGQPGNFGPSWETGKVLLDGSPIIVKLAA